MDSVSIGLDIGSSAVRAAEVEVGPGKRILRRYGQVGIPEGYVVDGEVVNVIGVAEALRRLWAEAGLSSHKVTLGISGPRVFVRQAEVPAMNKEDLRSSLRFDAQELVPIPLNESSFDMSILDPGSPPPDGSSAQSPEMRILLVAAHRDVLRTYLHVLKEAGLSAVAMDSSALALLRAVPSSASIEGRPALEALVSIGAEVTTVAVRKDDVPLFIRTLTVGGSKLTSGIASSLHLEMVAAERLKRHAVPSDTPQLAQARKVSQSDIRDLAEDVRATIDFFASQVGGGDIERLLLTGGASQTEGLAAAIGGNLPVQVLQIAPFAGFSTTNSGLTEADLQRASAGATTAIGLALWPFESPLIRLSVLPEEVAQARRGRRMARTAMVSVAAVAGVLALTGAAKVLEVRSAQSQARQAQQKVTQLNADVNRLQADTAVHGKMLARAQMDVGALTGDIDWDRVLGQLAAVMPPNVRIQSFTATRPATASAAKTGSSNGIVTLSVIGSGDASSAAAWLEGLQSDPDLGGSWVTGITISKSGSSITVSFSSNTNLTNTAQSNRAQEAKP